jgi:hypothetical protein
MDPIDYSGAFAPNLQSPIQAFTQGLQGGAALQQVQADQAQQQAVAARKQQMQVDLSNLSANPTPQTIAAASLKYPELSEQFKRSLDMLTPAQQQAKIAAAAPVHAAALSGEYGIAAKQLRQQADALQNSGNDQEAQQTRAMADLIEQHPETATVTTGMLLASAMGPDKYTTAFKDIGAEDRAAAQAPAALGEAKAKAASAQDDATLKGQQITAQKAGALSKVPGLKPAQVLTFLQSEGNAGRIAPDDLATLKSNVPTDPAALPGFLNSIMTSGVKPDDQQKYLAPDANAVLSARTQVQTTGMNNATQMAVQKEISAREDSKDDGEATNFTPQAVDNAAKRYNLDGTLPPMGMGKAASAGRTAILNRAAELAQGVDGTDQRQNQLNVKQQQRVLQDFTSGKSASAVRSFNVGISHLDTLGHLADALGNKDTQAVNRVGNYFATQTGSPAPTNFNAAKKIVGDEIVKAIVGAGGGVHDREEAAKVIDAANSPEQLRGAINTYKELMVGQLGGLERQYQQGSNRNDFERFLSPQAQVLRRQHAPAAPAAPTPAAHPTDITALLNKYGAQ